MTEFWFNLLMAKSTVAPLKKTTISRLELVACEIGTRLIKYIETSLELEDIPRYFWTDSTTSLAWIKRDDKWGTFVGNRVKKILSVSNPEKWKHVPGHMNPADLPSRGCNAKYLLESKWWEGPSWLKSDSQQWPVIEPEADEEVLNQERKKSSSATMVNAETEEQWYSPKRCLFSQYSKILLTMAYVLRFLDR